MLNDQQTCFFILEFDVPVLNFFGSEILGLGLFQFGAFVFFVQLGWANIYFHRQITSSVINFSFDQIFDFTYSTALVASKFRMAQKRPFDGEIIDDVSFKHPKHIESDEKINSFMDNVALHEPSPELKQSGGFPKRGSDIEEPATDRHSPKVTEDEYEAGLTRSVSLSPWSTSSTSEDDDNVDGPFHLPLSPNYFGFELPVRPAIQADDVYHALLDYPPRKWVPIGPEHQADIPEFGVKANTADADVLECVDQTSDGSCIGREEELAGICVIPMPESEPPVYNGSKVGDGRTDCGCLDWGSGRCVRQHIAEAREKLQKSIGEEAFEELGFYDMGEVVAEKWNEEEQQVFHEVIYSNPVSLGKNFWNVLSSVFASRTMKEIVSYYFNVFMLRKRADQNRYDPLNIDSDDDEWQLKNDNGDDGGMTDDDEDSAVKFVVGDDHHHCDVNGHHEDVLDEGCTDDYNTEAGEGEQHHSGQNDHYPVSQLLEKRSPDDDRDHEVQDGSCTSSDSRTSSQGGQVNHEEWRDYFASTPCDIKVWDGYMNWSKNKVDLLPTCSVIEEVFGDGNFDFQGKRW